MLERSCFMLRKLNLSVDHKQAIILIVFSILLFETLTVPTVLFVITCGIFIFKGLNPGVIFRHLTALGLFAVYWFTYGKIIDPEVGLNFLTSIVVLKLLEKESLRDRYMIFFGIMLLVSAGALFQKSLTYVLFFTLSFYVLVQDFYIDLGLPAKFKNILKLILWILPFTILLFVFVPRILSPFQIKKDSVQLGEIGYTPDVNISSVESLSGNDQVVFQANISGLSEGKQFYWRGNTVSSTDGWNWFTSSTDQNIPSFSKREKEIKNLISQKIRVFGTQDYFFSLDFPFLLITPSGESEFLDGRGFKQMTWQKFQRYEVLSFEEDFKKSNTVANQNRLLRYGVNPRDARWIEENFKSKSFDPLISEIKKYFSVHNFSYSLSPGKVETFSSFMSQKKVGFCSHYASAVGLILRAKGFKTRLVSGFLGAGYNEYGDFYQITQNDAHAWVEVWDKNSWRRIDPTDWIAPERIKLGGEAFVQMNSNQGVSSLRFLRPYLAPLDEVKKWLHHIDYKFYSLLEGMDYEGQKNFFEKFKIKKDWIFTIIPLLMILFALLYAAHLFRKVVFRSPIERLWLVFYQKMSRKGVELEFQSIEDIQARIKSEDSEIQNIFNDLILVTFSHKQIADLKKRIERI